MEWALETENLGKRFGRRAAVTPAVIGVSLRVPRRAVYGFVGANGAGKTTTIKLVLGLLRADTGDIRVFGRPRSSRRDAEPIGAMVESPALYDNLTGAETLDLTRRLLALPATEIGRVLEIVDLTSAATQRVGGYSLGMRQRLGIARALLGAPRLLILDEPTNGLDPDGIDDMRALMTTLPATGDVTLVVSSHLLVEVERIATHVGIIDAGRLIAQGTLAAVVGAAVVGDATGVEVETDDPPRAAALLAAHGFAVVDHGGRSRIATDDAAAVAALLVADGQRLRHLERRRPSLEDAYRARCHV